MGFFSQGGIFQRGRGFFQPEWDLVGISGVRVRGLGTGFMEFAGSHFYEEKFVFFLLKGLVSNGRSW